MTVHAIPDGYRAAIPYLIVRDAAAALAFYRDAFGARETLRLAEPTGRIGHAELRIGEALVMLADEYPDQGCIAPPREGVPSVQVMVYVADVDAVFGRALAAGAQERRPLRDEFYGDRAGTLVDPFGHRWTLATRIEDVSDTEMQRRYARLLEAAPTDA